MKLAIYDFDGTYIEKQTIPILFKLWKKHGLNKFAYKHIWRDILVHYFLYKLKIFKWDKRRFNPYAMIKTAELLNAIPKEKLDHFIKSLYLELQKHRFKPLIQQVAKDKKEGFTTVLLSGNLDIILQPFKKDGFDYIIGSSSINNNQLLASNNITILIEDRKKEMILDTFPKADLSISKAYADNGYDLPVLKMVGLPIAINPDRELFNYASKHQWKIFEKNDN